jgi:ABC-type uncharacterized transport system involved in gliding motility auxiliary subunit
MAELLFIATTVFVAYVVFAVVGKKETPEISKPENNPAASPEVAVQAETTVSPQPAEQKSASKRAPAKPKAAPTKATASTATATTPVDSLKNPKTGEIAKVPASYAFAKRWIKDALVEEGLLEKVYKNNELDANINAKIHDALQQLKAMDKYQ